MHHHNYLTLSFYHAGVFSLSIQPVYYVLPGSTVEVTCTVDGEPPPFIFWFNRNLRVFWNQYYSYDPDYGTIQMSNVTEEDEGRYGCLGSNRYDQIFKHFSLVIIGKSEECKQYILFIYPVIELSCNFFCQLLV